MKTRYLILYLAFSFTVFLGCSKEDTKGETQPPETEQPENPGKPEGPETPTDPEQPEKPEEPEQPDTPEPPSDKTLKIFQINTWMECNKVPNAYSGLTRQIAETDPDIVLLCELQNKGQSFVEKLCNSLNFYRKSYYFRARPTEAAPKYGTGVISKYPVTDISPVQSGVKVGLKVGERRVVVYSMHLNYLYYACYYPRGYDGNTWEKMETPITDVDRILKNNRDSGRPDAIRALIRDAAAEKQAGALIFVGGDFNEPSHLDWTEQTQDLWDHNGCVVPWDCSVLLAEAGFADSYRTQFPDPVAAPGFTFPAATPDVAVSSLSWAPDADERDRIDFIYYMTDPALTLVEAAVVGPNRSIANGAVITEQTTDRFIAPAGVWPTDHKGMFAVFRLE